MNARMALHQAPHPCRPEMRKTSLHHPYTKKSPYTAGLARVCPAEAAFRAPSPQACTGRARKLALGFKGGHEHTKHAKGLKVLKVCSIVLET